MTDLITEKECTLCKQVKPIDEFISSFTTGYTNRCALCRERGQRAHSKYVKKNREQVNEWYADYSRERQNAEPKPGFKVCPKCWNELPIESFPIGANGQRKKLCDECRAYYAMHQARWRKRYPDKAAAHNVEALRKSRDFRRRCLEHYGMQCACCGEAHYEFLAMDHIDGKGGLHRREVPASAFYRWLVKNNFPPGFRTLCWNCNWGCRLNNGVCPHELERQAA